MMPSTLPSDDTAEQPVSAAVSSRASSADVRGVERPGMVERIGRRAAPARRALAMMRRFYRSAFPVPERQRHDAGRRAQEQRSQGDAAAPEDSRRLPEV